METGVPKRGGSLTLGKDSQKILFFFGWLPLFELSATLKWEFVLSVSPFPLQLFSNLHLFKIFRCLSQQVYGRTASSARLWLASSMVSNFSSPPVAGWSARTAAQGVVSYKKQKHCLDTKCIQGERHHMPHLCGRMQHSPVEQQGPLQHPEPAEGRLLADESYREDPQLAGGTEEVNCGAQGRLIFLILN